ncbi:MAG: YlbF family regulator [Lachnospiraceae bacterium]|nr:YlbF family regulator [Lachnospiraceae bacterium]
MDDTDNLMEALIKELKKSPEYNQYISNLNEIKNNPELFNRISDFKTRSLEIQLRDNIDFIAENNRLQDEYVDMLSNEIVTEFLTAERIYVAKVRALRDKLISGAGIELKFIGD